MKDSTLDLDFKMLSSLNFILTFMEKSYFYRFHKDREPEIRPVQN